MWSNILSKSLILFCAVQAQRTTCTPRTRTHSLACLSNSPFPFPFLLPLTPHDVCMIPPSLPASCHVHASNGGANTCGSPGPHSPTPSRKRSAPPQRRSRARLAARAATTWRSEACATGGGTVCCGYNNVFVCACVYWRDTRGASSPADTSSSTHGKLYYTSHLRPPHHYQHTTNYLPARPAGSAGPSCRPRARSSPRGPALGLLVLYENGEEGGVSEMRFFVCRLRGSERGAVCGLLFRMGREGKRAMVL